MANANNSNMNVPNTFNLTGTWQNNVDPINSRTNPAQVQIQQQPRGISTANSVPISSNIPSNTINNGNSRQENLRNQTNSAGQNNQNSQVMPQNFNNSQILPQNNSSNTLNGSDITQNNDTNSGNCINCQNENAQTLANFAKSQIGRNTTIEFLLGENTLIEKSGTIVSVGENYILLNETGTRNLVACDLKNIKFIYFDY